jgi:uncharacterized protein (TIGR01370 family)
MGPMRRATITLAVWAGLLAAASGAAAAPSDGRLAAVETWGLAIGNKTLKGELVERYAGYDLLVVDGQEAKRRQVTDLRSSGKVVLGYLSVGTIEAYRPWYRLLKPYRLEAWKDWKDEFFADVSRRSYRRKMLDRIAPKLLAKGFDGLFLDNVDMIERHRRETKGMHKLVRGLSGLVRADGRLLFGQNGYDVLDPFLPYLDGWNREDVTGTYDFDSDRYRVNRKRRIAATQRELRAVGEAGLLVTATDYTRKPRGEIAEQAIASACAAGALPYVSDIELRRTPGNPPRCP